MTDTDNYRMTLNEDMFPKLNVKVGLVDFNKLDWEELHEEYVEDSRLKGLEPAELKELVLAFVRKNDHVFEAAAEGNFQRAEAHAKMLFGDNIDVYLEGRSNGWLVVEGLGTVTEWDEAQLAKWQDLEQECEDLVADIDRATVAETLLNWQAELAGRTRHVELFLVLDDADLMTRPDLGEWDWHGLLGLSTGSDVHVHATTKES